MAERHKITITVAGRAGVGKSAVMAIINCALCEAGLAEEEVTQVPFPGEPVMRKAQANVRFPGDYPDGTYEVVIQEKAAR